MATAAANVFDDSLRKALIESLATVQQLIQPWQREIEDNDWFAPDVSTYFLARGGSLSSCHEAKLLWEEAAKAPASAMTTGGFRHGSQEIISEYLRFGLWIDREWMRDQDLALASDLRKLGAKVLVIGQNIPADAGDLVFCLPAIPINWQFLIDIIPAQLAAEHLSHIRAVDCDSFQICSYIVEDESGLIKEPARSGRGLPGSNRSINEYK